MLLQSIRILLEEDSFLLGRPMFGGELLVLGKVLPLSSSRTLGHTCMVGLCLKVNRIFGEARWSKGRKQKKKQEKKLQSEIC